MNTAMASPPSHTLSHLELVRAAILAHSPDNNQPWRFLSEGDRLLVHLDPQRALPSDVNAMCDLMGLGAANALPVLREVSARPDEMEMHQAPVEAGPGPNLSWRRSR